MGMSSPDFVVDWGAAAHTSALGFQNKGDGLADGSHRQRDQHNRSAAGKSNALIAEIAEEHGRERGEKQQASPQRHRGIHAASKPALWLRLALPGRPSF